MAAGVVFHELRRERVRERDIFRFGTGMVLLLVGARLIRVNKVLATTAGRKPLQEEKYPP